MTQEQLAVILQTSGLPVSYQDFPDEQCPPMPYIIFEDTGSSQVYADGIVYAAFTPWTIVLFTARKDAAKESLVENALTSAEIAWTKTTEEDDEEQCMRVTYNIETIGG